MNMSKRPTYEELEQRIKALEKSESKLKQAEEELQKREEQYRLLFETASELITISDINGKPIWVNSAWTKVFGSISEYKANPFDMIHPDDKEKMVKAWKNLISNNKVIKKLEYRYQFQAGEYKTFETSVNKVELRGETYVYIFATDITERKLAEEETQKFKTVFDRSNYGMAIVGFQGNILYINESFAGAHGYCAEELVGKNLSIFHTEAQMVRVMEINSQIMRTGSYSHEEVWHVKTDGTVFPMLMNGVVIYNSKGEPEFIAATAIDITERKQVEEALKESEYLYKETQRLGKMGGWSYDVESEQSTFTDTIYEIYGKRFLTAEEGTQFYHPDDKEIVCNSFNEVITKQKPYDLEVRFINAQGDNLFVRTIGQPLIENGKVVKIYGNLIDITERKKAEKVISEGKQKFELLIKNSPDMMMIQKTSGEISYASSQSKEILGFAGEEVKNLDMQKQIHPDDLDYVINKELDALKGKDVINIEYRFIKKNGDVVWLNHTARPIIIDSEITEIQSIVRDITERKQAEIELIEAKEKAEESEAKFKQLSNLTFEGIVLHQNGIAIDINLSFAEIFGYTREEMIGKNVVKLLVKEECHNIISQNIIKNHALPYEVVGLRKDGTELPLEIEARDIESDNKTIRVAAVRVISERKKLEKELQKQNKELIIAKKEAEESERKTKEIINNTKIQMWAFGGESYSYINDDWYNFTGKDRNIPMTIQLLFSCMHPEDVKSFSEIWMKNWETKTEHDNYFRLKRYDGIYRYFYGHAVPVSNIDGTFKYFQGFNIDITERRQAEKTLQKSELRFRMLFESMSEGVCLHELIYNDNRDVIDYRIINLNTRCEKILGLKKEEILNKLASEVYGVSEPPFLETYKDVAQAGEPVQFETYFSPMDKHFSISVFSPGKDQFATVFEDITVRKQAEEELRLHSEMMKNMVEGVYLIGLDDVLIKYANPEFEKMFGYKKGEMIGKHASIVNAPTDKDPTETAKEIMKTIDDTGEWHGEVKNIKKDGTSFWCSANVSMFKHSKFGEVVIAVHSDITERKQAEEELRVNRLLLRNVLDIVPVFICAKNLDGKFILVNKKLTDFYGSTVEAMTNVLHADLCEDKNELLAMLAADREVIESGKSKFIPAETMENPDGSITVLETYKIPFTAFGEPAVLIASNDITERKQFEAELIKANENLKKLASSERLAYTGRVASGIAHEIRNPSTNVSLTMELLCEAFEPHGKQMKYVEIIERNLTRINYLISELQNCARPPEMMVKPHDIHKLLENVIDSVDAKIIVKEINVVRNYTSRGSIVKVDREHIERVFLNLVLNAIEAIPRKRGTITVTTECDEKYFLIKIQDTGKGIAPESLFKIFDPFFSSKPNGVGLGLATCYGVIVSHGGTIEVDGELSKGALFTVSLPQG